MYTVVNAMFKHFLVVLLVAYVGVLGCNALSIRSEPRKFPDGFLFGSASASYQIEGAWNEDGKSENIWDWDTHQNPSPIQENATGDIAVDSYHLYERDVEMIRELGLDFYRFSLSWTRILPTSFPDQINQAGVDYYNNVINELLKYNIEPMITLYHWDLPKKLQDMGGWTNPHIVDWYGDYVRVAYELFGDRVKYWITINEPVQICQSGYGEDSLAPRLNILGVADYICSKNLLLAHARAYRIYDEEFRAAQGGSIFITLSAKWCEPDSDSATEAAEDCLAFNSGIYAHPIFSRVGDWPANLKERIASKSAEQGFARSRLPDFTQEEVEYVRGTSDYFGLNHYSSYMVNRNETALSSYEIPSRNHDAEYYQYQLDDWLITPTDRVRAAPWGFYNLLVHFKDTYDNPPIFITENGLGAENIDLEDDNRVTYYRGYIGAVLDAIDDGVDIRGYTAWCLMDNFEWSLGYTVRYGLYQVDFDSPERTRTPRKSAFMYKELVRTRELDLDFEPDASAVMTIDEGH